MGATPTPYRVAAIENINGQAITLATKHKDNRDPKKWKGFGYPAPTSESKKFVVMGKEFNPAKPADYVNGFAIKKA